MRHLSEDEFYEVVSGTRRFRVEVDGQTGVASRVEGGFPAGHMAECAECRTEVDRVRGSVEGLREAATAMARSEFRPLLPMRRATVSATSRVAWPLALAAAGVLCAASVTIAHRSSVPWTSAHGALSHWNTAPHGVAGAEDGAAQVSAVSEAAAAEGDEALLDGIDQDLAAPVPPPLAPLAVGAGESGTTAPKLD